MFGKAMLIVSLVSGVYQPSVVFQRHGVMDGQGDAHWDLHPKKGYYLQVDVSSPKADLSCYLTDSKHRIYVSDESGNNKCSFGFYADGQPLRLWVQNNDKHGIYYTVQVKE